jgi:hypothetical protein
VNGPFHGRRVRGKRDAATEAWLRNEVVKTDDAICAIRIVAGLGTMCALVFAHAMQLGCAER